MDDDILKMARRVYDSQHRILGNCCRTKKLKERFSEIHAPISAFPSSTGFLLGFRDGGVAFLNSQGEINNFANNHTGPPSFFSFSNGVMSVNLHSYEHSPPVDDFIHLRAHDGRLLHMCDAFPLNRNFSKPLLTIGNVLLAAVNYNSLRLWNIESGAQSAHDISITHEILICGLDTWHNHLIVACSSGSIYGFDISSLKLASANSKIAAWESVPMPERAFEFNFKLFSGIELRNIQVFEKKNILLVVFTNNRLQALDLTNLTPIDNYNLKHPMAHIERIIQWDEETALAIMSDASEQILLSWPVKKPSLSSCVKFNKPEENPRDLSNIPRITPYRPDIHRYHEMAIVRYPPSLLFAEPTKSIVVCPTQSKVIDIQNRCLLTIDANHQGLEYREIRKCRRYSTYEASLIHLNGTEPKPWRQRFGKCCLIVASCVIIASGIIFGTIAHSSS